MNRLVIIGNGFDLAHGLPTSYKDFIDDYSKRVIEYLKKEFKYEDEFFKIKLDLKQPINQFDSRKLSLLNSINDIFEYVQSFNVFNNSTNNKNEFIIKNHFFKTICDLNKSQNWVDIENEFYKILLKTINPDPFPELDFNKKDNEKKITKLNREFEDIKRLLDIYLGKTDGFYSLNLEENPFLDFIKCEENIKSPHLNHFYKELPYKEMLNLSSKLHQQDNPENLPSPVLKVTNYFLNFNYTNTLNKYFDNLNISKIHQNQLHGLIKSKDNPINFGFGDEKDSNYQIIENKNDNEFLTNIKSFHYFNTPNYKNLLNFIDGNKFQIFIMGHSCGLSDRTMLNTIFEHPNCISIKVFYHQREDGTDNYTEIVQNISRHFTDKKIMREKIVNKTLCRPLPQNSFERKT